MKSSDARLLDELLELSPEARAAVACALLDSLEEPPHPHADVLWEAEIKHRIREVERGAIGMVPWSEARERILRG